MTSAPASCASRSSAEIEDSAAVNAKVAGSGSATRATLPPTRRRTVLIRQAPRRFRGDELERRPGQTSAARFFPRMAAVHERDLHAATRQISRGHGFRMGHRPRSPRQNGASPIAYRDQSQPHGVIKNQHRYAVAVHERLGHNGSGWHVQRGIQRRQSKRAPPCRRNACPFSAGTQLVGGTGASLLIHGLILGALVWAVTHRQQIVNTVTQANENLAVHFSRSAEAGPRRRWWRPSQGSGAAAQGGNRRGQTAGREADPEAGRRPDA